MNREELLEELNKIDDELLSKGGLRLHGIHSFIQDGDYEHYNSVGYKEFFEDIEDLKKEIPEIADTLDRARIYGRGYIITNFDNVYYGKYVIKVLEAEKETDDKGLIEYIDEEIERIREDIERDLPRSPSLGGKNE